MANTDDLDLLFAAPLDEFIRRRDELAKRLKAEGSADDSKAVKALRKPAVSAWVVNQLARSHPDDVRALVVAGEEIEEAQRRTLSGERVGFESARRDENAAIQRLRAAAAEIMPSITSATIERVTSSLMAGARSAEGRALLVEGRLTTDLEAQGFGAFAGFTAAPAPAVEPADHPPVSQQARSGPELPAGETDTLESSRRELAATVESSAASAKVAETKATDAERGATKAEEQAKHADTRAMDADAEAKVAKAKAKEARAKAVEADRRARASRKEATVLRREAREAAESLKASEEALAALGDGD